MSLETRVRALAAGIGDDIKSLRARVSTLETPPAPTRNIVVVGSSNAIPSTNWPATIAAGLGATVRNVAVAGAAISNGGFLTQLTAARDDASFANSTVTHVFLVDCSNDIRANNDAGNVVDVYAAGGTLLSTARTAFPNARVIVLPVIWPSNPSATGQSSTVPGGYQVVWHRALALAADALRRRAMENGCEFIEDSWTWITGHDEWMEGTPAGTGGVHPNALGYAQVAQWVLKYLRGEPTTSRTPWTGVPVNNSTYYASEGSAFIGAARPLTVKRDGWKVRGEGTVYTKVEIGAGPSSDWCTVPIGFRPTYAVEGVMRLNGLTTHYPIQIYPNGTIRIVHNVNVPAGTICYFTFEYDMG